MSKFCVCFFLLENFSIFLPKVAAVQRLNFSLSIKLKDAILGSFYFFVLRYSSAALEEALIIVHNLWIYLAWRTEKWERKDEQGNRKERKATIKRLRSFLLTSLAVKLTSPLHYPSHCWLCGALPLARLTLSSLVLCLFLPCICLLVSPFSLQAFLFFASHPILYLAHNLTEYLPVSLRPLCVPSSLTLSFPLLSLIYNSTLSSFPHLCPPSLTVIVSLVLQQITSAHSNRHNVHIQTGAGYPYMGPLIILLHLLHVRHSAESWNINLCFVWKHLKYNMVTVRIKCPPCAHSSSFFM